MGDKHLSTPFHSELHALSPRVMELGGLVESQIRRATCETRVPSDVRHSPMAGIESAVK